MKKMSPTDFSDDRRLRKFTFEERFASLKNHCALRFSMNIYVGNLAYTITEDELRDFFSEYGEVVSVKIITDGFSGKSKGFGFVEMTNETEAENAINDANGKEIKNRAIVVNKARPRKNQN